MESPEAEQGCAVGRNVGRVLGDVDGLAHLLANGGHHRDDFLRKIRSALNTEGFRFLLMLSPCPTGWKSEPDQSIALIRAAVGCGLFPVYEVFNGTRYVISMRPDHTPINEYIEKQRRYSGLAADPDRLRSRIRDQWQYLERMATDLRPVN